jgi:predicted ATP-grasp superfamily ATP-dependent carboligase
VLVLDAESRKAVAVVRALHAAGWHVICASESLTAPARFSRNCKGFLRLPPPASSSFLPELDAAVTRFSLNSIFPLEDDSIRRLAASRDSLPGHATLPVPDHGKLETALDKYETCLAAERAGVPYPPTVLVNSVSALHEASESIGFPLVIKTRRGSGSRGVSLVENRSELAAKYSRLSGKEKGILAQRFVPHGGAYGFCALCRDGEVLTSLTFRRIREFPISGGPSTCRVTERIPDAEIHGKKLLREMRWESLAMVEFRRDAQTGILYLMEINPRIWGSIALSVCAGINFPALAIDAAAGRTVEHQPWREGIVRRWFFGEMMHFIRKKRPLTAAGEALLMFLKPDECDILDWRDPFPFLMTTAGLFHMPFRRGFRDDVLRRGL